MGTRNRAHNYLFLIFWAESLAQKSYFNAGNTNDGLFLIHLKILKIDLWNWHWPETRYNVAPTTRVTMVLRADDALLELNVARWGLIPHWWKKDTPPSLTFNARSEEAEEKPT